MEKDELLDNTDINKNTDYWIVACLLLCIGLGYFQYSNWEVSLKIIIVGVPLAILNSILIGNLLKIIFVLKTEKTTIQSFKFILSRSLGSLLVGGIIYLILDAILLNQVSIFISCGVALLIGFFDTYSAFFTRIQNMLGKTIESDEKANQ